MLRTDYVDLYIYIFYFHLYQIKELQEKGDNAYGCQNFNEALENYNDALDIDEDNTEALASRAATKIEMRNFPEAHEDIKKLLSINPLHPQVLNTFHLVKK